MVKRAKKLEKGIESIKKEIEEHFLKMDTDIGEKNYEAGKYHAKEIDRSLFVALEHKISLLGEEEKYAELVKSYKNRLEEYKKKLGIND